jgi:hypothetical protein
MKSQGHKWSPKTICWRILSCQEEVSILFYSGLQLIGWGQHQSTLLEVHLFKCKSFLKNHSHRKIRYGLAMKSPQPQAKGSCVEDLVPNSVCRGGDLRKWLGHEDSDLINGLVIIWWYYWEVVGTSRYSLVGGSRSLGVCPRRVHLCPFLSLSLSASCLSSGKQLFSATPCATMFCLIITQKQWGQVSIDWNLWICEQK